jgi:predicted aspartyl protease
MRAITGGLISRSCYPEPVRIKLLVLLVGASVAGAAAADWKGLVKREDWFGLRDAASVQPAPSFYAGAIAAAFDRGADATRILGTVIAGSPASREADMAREWLIDLHFRSGHYRSALDELKPLLDRHPRERSLLEARSLFTSLAQQGDMEVAARAPARSSWHTEEGNMFVPVVVNGVGGDYILDTGANISVLSVSEAQRLGLKLQGGQGTGKDYAGNNLAFQAAIAPELRLGRIVLRNVPFGVVPDKQEPFVDLPEGKRGVLGISILLAVQTWRWSKDGSLEMGFASAGYVKGRENLAFSGSTPLLLAAFAHTLLAFHLDTGATHTDLWPAFARRYPAMLSRRGTSRITGVGGSRDVSAAKLGTFDLLIDGHQLQLHDVRVLLKPPGSGSRPYYGNLGIDLFEHAQRVTLDFTAMRMTVE